MHNETKIVLLDSNSLINRAFHALPPLTINNGLFTNGIYGYMTMFSKLLHDEHPTHICAVFDCRAKTFRHKMSETYKATRKPMPEELAMQVPVLQDLLKKMGVKILFKEGYEADDILGTLAKRFHEKTLIVSGDRDVLQLVDDSTTVFNTKKGLTEVKKYTPEALAEEGFTPEQIIEFKGLAGDSSDNISGCPGVGEKTAKDLLKKYHSINGIYQNIDEIQGKLKEKLVNNKDLVYLSKQLATIDTHADIECELQDLAFQYLLPIEAFEMMKYLQFKNLLEKFNFKEGNINNQLIAETKNSPDDTAPEQTFVLRKINSDTFTIDQMDALTDVIEEIKNQKIFYTCIETENIILATKDKTYKIVTSYSLLNDGISFDDATNAIAPLYSEEYTNIFFDAKKNLHALSEYGITVSKPYEDLMLMGYLVKNTKAIKSEKTLLEDYGFDSMDHESVMMYLYEELESKIREKNLLNLYYSIELPLIEVLFDMEKTGFKVNINILNALNEKYSNELNVLIEKIYDLAGEQFNINSTKQLAYILFEKIGLTPTKKTKTGYSVDAEALEELDHPIVNELIRYRELSKLKSTYIEGMKTVINPISGKVHSCFNQCITATGRLSSTEPNLQNIPIRRSEGREIRKMFIPSLGGKLVTADYSQIELRLLAHFSEEPHLLEEYRHNGDVHALTASKIFNVPLVLVTPEMRSSAKAVNFGIIYGISSFGLAKNAGVARYQAKQFIDNYFETYPNVKKYMEQNVELAKKQGYLTTLCGRIRYFPELTSSKHNIRAFGERAAMNMPLQGTASDIIKISMLKVYRELKNRGLKAKLILQVHDELILDVPTEEVEEVKKLLKECMESAVNLKVPLIANVASGDNWYESK